MIVYTALINQVTEFRKCWLYCRAEFAPGLLYTSTIFFFFFFGSTQGFILARQVLLTFRARKFYVEKLPWAL
jgi:hypothetical protein